jgi:chromosome partitioning protein
VAVVVCLAAEKGGVGKSTVAANLAAAFALDGLTTVLIDLDPQGTASSAWLNVDADDVSSVAYLIRPEAGATMTVGEGWQPVPGVANLYVVPADHDALVIRGRAMVTEMNAGLILRNRLQALQVGTAGEYADIVIIDTKGADPHEPLVASGLIAADYVLPVLVPEPAQLDGIVRVVQAVRTFTADGVTNATVLPPLVNQFPHANQGRKAANVAQSLLDDAGVPLASTRIHAWSDIRMAQAEHVPVAIHAPKSKAAGEYRALVAELSRVMNVSRTKRKAVSA